MEVIETRNPGTGELIEKLPIADLKKLPEAFALSRQAQADWSRLTLKQRSKQLLLLRETVLNNVDTLVDILAKENGKPRFEALSHDILPIIDLITFFAKKGPKILADQKIPMVLMKHKKSIINYYPLGVIAVIAPWNFPFSIPFGEVVMALMAGNSVILKPSEITPLIGVKIQELCEEAGLPRGLVQTITGDGKVGAAIIDQKPDKVFFTGSVATGKKIAERAGRDLIPVNLELGGKDPMIIMGDADIDFATSAALWGGFCNSGQVCASTERLIVHESIADEFLVKYKEKIQKLRQGPSTQGGNDLGAITFEKQKLIYQDQIDSAKKAGAIFVTGGEFSDDKRYLKPTVVTGDTIETLDIFNEETFGPVVAVTRFKTPQEAIEKANRSRYGLCASIITNNHSQGEAIAKELEAGTITINEVTYTHGLAETPWGGVKESGIGRTHSAHGLLEFANSRHIHKPRSRSLVFKSLWWFPYTDYQYATFRNFLNLYRRHFIDKVKAVSIFLWNAIQFIKTEKRY